MGAKRLSNIEKVAVLLVGFGEEVSSEIFKNMSESEIKRLAGTINRLGRMEQQEVDEVMEEFYEVLQQKTTTLSGGSDFASRVLTKALGAEAAEGFTTPHATMESVDMIDAEGLARIVSQEHPQTMALILAHVEPKKCGDIIKLLPEALHTEIIIRMTNLESVDPEIIQEIDDHLREEITMMGSWGNRKLGGADKVAAILAAMDKNSGETILENLEERDPDLSEEIRSLMFTFEDLIKVTGPGIQEILKVVKGKTLQLALKTASEPLFDHFMSNLSQRAATLFKEDLTAMPKSRLSDVQEAQNEVLEVCHRLEEEGKVTIEGDGDEFV